MTSTNIPPSHDRLVWYAVYGSNLLRKRFNSYIAGGKPDGSRTDYPGCRDKTPPREDRPIALTHALYFAGHSNSWAAAIAFVRHAASGAQTLGRMFLISYGQFNDVVRQENARGVPGAIVVPLYDELAHGDQWPIDAYRLYGRFIKTGVEDGHPVLTLTATQDNFAVGKPSEAYVKTIAAGLEETYSCMGKSEILDYLAKAEGIRGLFPPDVLATWIVGR
jgi:hypothetical protein